MKLVGQLYSWLLGCLVYPRQRPLQYAVYGLVLIQLATNHDHAYHSGASWSWWFVLGRTEVERGRPISFRSFLSSSLLQTTRKTMLSTIPAMLRKTMTVTQRWKEVVVVKTIPDGLIDYMHRWCNTSKHIDIRFLWN